MRAQNERSLVTLTWLNGGLLSIETVSATIISARH
jgi:hypothetical protein